MLYVRFYTAVKTSSHRTTPVERQLDVNNVLHSMPLVKSLDLKKLTLCQISSVHPFDYRLPRFMRREISPARPRPSRPMVAGSGTAVTTIRGPMPLSAVEIEP